MNTNERANNVAKCLVVSKVLVADDGSLGAPGRAVGALRTALRLANNREHAEGRDHGGACRQVPGEGRPEPERAHDCADRPSGHKAARDRA